MTGPSKRPPGVLTGRASYESGGHAPPPSGLWFRGNHAWAANYPPVSWTRYSLAYLLSRSIQEQPGLPCLHGSTLLSTHLMQPPNVPHLRRGTCGCTRCRGMTRSCSPQTSNTAGKAKQVPTSVKPQESSPVLFMPGCIQSESNKLRRKQEHCGRSHQGSGVGMMPDLRQGRGEMTAARGMEQGSLAGALPLHGGRGGEGT